MSSTSTLGVFLLDVRCALEGSKYVSFEVPPFFVPYPLYDAAAVADGMVTHLKEEGHTVQRQTVPRSTDDRDWDLWPMRSTWRPAEQVLPFPYDESDYVTCLAAPREFVIVTRSEMRMSKYDNTSSGR